MALIPLNRTRIVEELAIVIDKLYFLGGDDRGGIMQKTQVGWTFRKDDRTDYWHETLKVDGPEVKRTRADVYRRAFEIHGKILCTCKRRLIELLNHGDVELFDCDHKTITTLQLAWSVVEQLPDKPVEFQLQGRQTLLRVSTHGTLVSSIVIENLSDDTVKKAYYLGDGIIQVGTVRRILTVKSHVSVLEQLVADRVATTRTLGVSNAAKVIGELRTIHNGILAPYITTSTKAKRGYATTIENGGPIRELLDKLASQ